MKMITYSEALNFRDKRNYMIVDLRSRVDYQKGHINGAINLPAANLRMIEKLNIKNKIWILYCKKGNASLRLALEMEEKGYDVMTVIGGYKG